jgi:hypothetical protein
VKSTCNNNNNWPGFTSVGSELHVLICLAGR